VAPAESLLDDDSTDAGLTPADASAARTNDNGRDVLAERVGRLASGLAAVAQLRAWRARCRVTQAKVDPDFCQLPGHFGAAQPVGVEHRHTTYNGTRG
jgi:hypothetical protein